MTNSRSAAAALLLLAASAGCSTRIVTPGDISAPPAGVFSHELFDRVLARSVDDRGGVDYTALQLDHDELDAYFRLVERYSPDRTPELFPSEPDRLAYWINAYNAATIETVLHYYPINSVLDVKKPALAFFLPRTAGFFYFQKVRLGGEETSLYKLENDIIRKRFAEPRIHFALNCGSASCPDLPRRAFTADALDDELEREARKFVSQPRNLRIDHEAKTVYLSAIFDWYRDDFESWYRERSGDPSGGLLDYVSLYAGAKTAAELEEVADSYDIAFIPYDWALNDQQWRQRQQRSTKATH